MNKSGSWEMKLSVMYVKWNGESVHLRMGIFLLLSFIFYSKTTYFFHTDEEFSYRSSEEKEGDESTPS